MAGGDRSVEEKVGILIVGAGPTGLGAAARLTDKGEASWQVVDASQVPGGLAATDTTEEGFLFDMGGHVIFSHYQFFDDLLDAALGEGEGSWNYHQRVSYVYIRNRFVAYPFQNNIAQLPTEDQERCLTGLVTATVENSHARSKPANFDEWILRTQGPGIADLFMRPYNFKVWAVPTTVMASDWLGERVATADVHRAIRNVLWNQEDGNWGPNATFRFPKAGGTGCIWSGVFELLPRKNLSIGGNNNAVVSIDADNKVATTASGRRIRYDSMLSTLPLDNLMSMVGRPELVEGLFHSSSHIVGIGIRGNVPHGKKCWLYFPENNCPFYRATIFSNYARANCPPDERQLPTLCMGDGTAPSSGEKSGGPWWSLMFEVSEPSYKQVDQNSVQIGSAGAWPKVVLDTIRGAVATKLISESDEIVSISHRRIEHGYPTPTLERDNALAASLPWLRERGIWSRGRFGSWKYEVANQDHSCMLGVEAVDNILHGSAEITLNHPTIVNKKRDEDIRFRGKNSPADKRAKSIPVQNGDLKARA